MDNKNELITFLKNAKTIVKFSPPSSGIHIIIGNESADLDSFVCAVVYAFYLSKIPQVGETLHYIPVICIHEDDLPLRTEITALLDKLKIQKEDFVYLNDIDFNALPITKVTLVDHNNRANHLKDVEQHVCEIIDHHEDSEEFENISKNIKMVGSCATLVAEEIYYSKHSILSIFPIADLLLSAILIDSVNLDLHAGKTKELDIFIGEILSNHVPEDSDELYEFLLKAKMDILSMSTWDILRKDYKSVSTSQSKNIGISSVSISSVNVLSRNDFLQTAEDYMSKVHIDVLVILFVHVKESSSQVHREIAVVAMDTSSLEMVTSHLMSRQEELQLHEKHEFPKDFKKYIRIFDQNPKLSRKFILPFLKKC